MSTHKPRPHCAGCSKPYGQRDTSTESVFYLKGETRPEYKGNLIVTAEDESNWGGEWLEEKGRIVEQLKPDKFQIQRRLWDGESYRTPYKPFCTLRCALAFARRAVAKGFKG